MCPACPDGEFTLTTGAFSRQGCQRCQVGEYYLGTVSNTTGALCERCPEFATTAGNTGGSDVTACKCQEHYFGIRVGARDCTECPDGARCEALGTHLQSIVLRPGYWRPSVKSLPQLCPHPEVCSGGLTTLDEFTPSSNDSCTAGRGVHGAFCTLCINSNEIFDEVEQRCVPPDSSVAFYAVIILLIFLLAMRSAILRYYGRRAWCPSAPGTARHAVLQALSDMRSQVGLAMRKSIVPLKICISFYQASSASSVDAPL